MPVSHEIFLKFQWKSRFPLKSRISLESRFSLKSQFHGIHGNVVDSMGPIEIYYFKRKRTMPRPGDGGIIDYFRGNIKVLRHAWFACNIRVISVEIMILTKIVNFTTTTVSLKS